LIADRPKLIKVVYLVRAIHSQHVNGVCRFLLPLLISDSYVRSRQKQMSEINVGHFQILRHCLNDLKIEKSRWAVVA
jgi:CRISPR/Cas system-associated endonuclease Cas3-HD